MKFERHLDAEVVSMLSLSDGYVLPLTLSSCLCVSHVLYDIRTYTCHIIDV